MTSNCQSGQRCRSFGLGSQRQRHRLTRRTMDADRGSACEAQRKECSRRVFPSAKTPCRDILFRHSAQGQNPAACGRSRQYVRTTDPARKAHFGPFFVSLGPLSPTQPNHGHSSTDVEAREFNGFERTRKGAGLEGRSLRRSEQGSNCPGSVCPRKGSVSTSWSPASGYPLYSGLPSK
jgi:hypothetical protein